MKKTEKKIGILVENNYQELEFWYPYLRLQEAGLKPCIIAPEKKTYKSKMGYEVKPDVVVKDVLQEDFDAIIIPGGYAPDLMRTHKPILELVKSTYERGAVIAAICHAAWVLISAGIVSEKKATCYHSVKDDLVNAGANYRDESVVVDGNLITSRQPDDLPNFCTEILKKLNE